MGQISGIKPLKPTAPVYGRLKRGTLSVSRMAGRPHGASIDRLHNAYTTSVIGSKNTQVAAIQSDDLG